MQQRLAIIITASLLLAFPARLWAIDRSVAAAGINAAVLRSAPASLTGAGVTVGILDDKIAPHPNLTVAGNGGSGVPTAHATEVAGVINSNHPQYTGVAPGARLYGYTVAIWEDTFTGAHWLVDRGATIIAYPFGWQADGDILDGSSWESRHVDFLARDRDIFFAISGNQDVGGYPLPTDAYNGLTINATVMTASGRYDQLAGWNNYTEVPVDGRCKPDLVAPGGYEDYPERHPESIYSTTLGGGFANNSGTSFATPHLAGTAALLTQYGRQHSLSTNHNVLKSVLISSADKRVRDQSGQDWLQSEAYTDATLPLDDQLGAGQLDAATAYEQYRAGRYAPGTVPLVGWDLGSVTGAGNSQTYRLQQPLAAGSFLTATLAWDRRVTLEDDQNHNGKFDVNDTDWLAEHALNNLDIRLYDEHDVFVTGSLSTVDNVEHLYWQVPQDGRYYLKVQFEEQKDLATQEYSLAWSIDPLALTTAAAGDWAAAATWDHGVLTPSARYQAVVAGQAVALTSDGGARSLALRDSGGSLVIAPGKALTVAEGVDVTGGRLEIQGDLRAATADVAAGTLDLAADGLLSVAGELTLEPSAEYSARVGAAIGGARTVAGHVTLGGKLSLGAVSRLLQAPGAWGSATQTLISSTDPLTGTFSPVPPAGEYLGHGALFAGVVYGAQTAKVNLFQAAPGDTASTGVADPLRPGQSLPVPDRQINSDDIQQILAGTRFNSGQLADWSQGDFNDDGACNSDDIQLILASNLFNAGPYGAAAAAGGALGAGPQFGAGLPTPPAAQLRVTPAGLLIDTEGATVNGYVLTSAAGIFTGAAADNLGLFQEDTDSRISGQMFFSLDGTHLLGRVIGTEFSDADLWNDLKMAYTIEGRAGIYEAILAVPEPGTAVLCLSGLLAWLLWRRRR